MNRNLLISAVLIFPSNTLVRGIVSLPYYTAGLTKDLYSFPLSFVPIFLLLLLFTQPLPRDGGMAEDHGAPEAGQLSRVWTRGRKETKTRQRVSGAKSP